jgi:hypothetical protein
MSTLGERVNAVEFDHPFTITNGEVIDVPNAYAPSVYLAEGEDSETIDGQGWEFVSHGWTGQYGYNGPVMHASEFIGEGIAERLAEIAEDYQAFATVIVDFIPEDEDDQSTEPVGWAIVGLPR